MMHTKGYVPGDAKISAAAVVSGGAPVNPHLRPTPLPQKWPLFNRKRRV